VVLLTAGKLVLVVRTPPRGFQNGVKGHS
jgi:hypothetical protein